MPGGLRRGARWADALGMSSTVSPAAWLRTAMTPDGPPAGRHRAPEAGPVEPLTSEQIARVGRHRAPDADEDPGPDAGGRDQPAPGSGEHR